MDQTALNAVRNWFDAYTRSFAADGGGLPPMLQLKLDHSRRVADDCAAIARDLGWSAAETAAAEALGLLHDTARFPQYATYRTFSDRRSIDHGEHGRLIVEREGVLAAAGDVYGRSILDGIRYHNKRDVPAGLAPDSLKLVNLVRDADKLDIFYIINDAVLNDRTEMFPELLLDVNPRGRATPALVAEIKASRQGSYENIRSLADIFLVRTAWIFGMTYAPTLRRIAERKLLLDLRDAIPHDPEVTALIDAARAHIQSVIGPPEAEGPASEL
ncbi:MAG TPA: HD domain-containing protein [Planctomycetota bacterium]|jgi:hypothetical protein|nr:HD domain-containing protein [Planctomycetota bacterium]OQC19162.1 MAG: HD domain protein [Planctomycetes bacterium ADurb.Bin069]NMD34656.1 HD domain-containing protein [Planctomycetota bacterium]HNS00433.1 HD domain-containing protein [Planctomycetota bacterium]HNU27514.1 HD domain-containing protein [Planctomycetota bacterium]